MKIAAPLVQATFLHRLSRFSVEVELAGRREPVHLPNSGRLRELLTPGEPVLLAPMPIINERVSGLARRPIPARRTHYDLVLVVTADDRLVSADARLPNLLFAEALATGRLAEFRGYTLLRREVRWRESRLDFLLGKEGERCLVEVKSVTLVREGTALFPDAPSQRGVRHLRELVRAQEEGYQGAVVFVVQRDDALRFQPNDEADAEFAHALREAMGQGIRAYAYGCHVSRTEIELVKGIPVVATTVCPSPSPSPIGPRARG